MKRRRWKFTCAPITAFFLIGTAFLDRTGLGVATAMAALFHELGHFVAARLMGIPIASVRIDLLGARIETRDRLLSFSEEWLFDAAGPLFSLLGSILGAPLWQLHSFFLRFSVASLLLGALNLLPVKTFDGGRMTEMLLSRFFGARGSFCVMQGITLGVLFFLWAASGYLLLRADGGMLLFAFFFSLLARFLETGKIG